MRPWFSNFAMSQKRQQRKWPASLDNLVNRMPGFFLDCRPSRSQGITSVYGTVSTGILEVWQIEAAPRAEQEITTPCSGSLPSSHPDLIACAPGNHDRMTKKRQAKRYEVKKRRLADLHLEEPVTQRNNGRSALQSL